MSDLQDKSGTTLRAIADVRGLSIGTAVDLAALKAEPQYRETLRREFSLCVAENACKPHAVWKGPTLYDFSGPDLLAEFAQENGMILRGHTLVWHQSIPQWLRDGDYSPPVVQEMLKAYIHAFVGRYQGRIRQWDVVNEAVADGVIKGGETGLRQDSFWYRTLGPDYMNLAFRWASEADPDARLYYNDYNAEDLGPKSNAVYALVQGLQAQGVPLHGVGLQCHFENGWRVTDDHLANVRRLAALGLDWQVTECDIRIHLDGADPTAEQLAEQACGYGDLIRLCLTERRCRGFVVWGLADRHSWIPGFRAGWGAALPLDLDYRPKPAYDAIEAALWNFTAEAKCLPKTPS